MFKQQKKYLALWKNTKQTAKAGMMKISVWEDRIKVDFYLNMLPGMDNAKGVCQLTYQSENGQIDEYEWIIKLNQANSHYVFQRNTRGMVNVLDCTCSFEGGYVLCDENTCPVEGETGEIEKEQPEHRQEEKRKSEKREVVESEKGEVVESERMGTGLPRPQPDPAPRPVPQAKPQPMPRPQPDPAPRPVAKPQPVPRSQPDPTPRPVAKPQPGPQAKPQPRPQMMPAQGLGGNSFPQGNFSDHPQEIQDLLGFFQNGNDVKNGYKKEEKDGEQMAKEKTETPDIPNPEGITPDVPKPEKAKQDIPKPEKAKQDIPKPEKTNRRYQKIRYLYDVRDLLKEKDQMAELLYNSFLLHGFYQYRHLILTDEFLGVPGNFYDREASAARMMGFPYFIEEQRLKNCYYGDGNEECSIVFDDVSNTPPGNTPPGNTTHGNTTSGNTTSGVKNGDTQGAIVSGKSNVGKRTQKPLSGVYGYYLMKRKQDE